MSFNPNILTMPLVETFQCSGLAESVLAAHVMSRNALVAVLGGDPAEAWSLKMMTHSYTPADPSKGRETPGVSFSAEFARNPEYDEEGN
jgi:hypothetical protein